MYVCVCKRMDKVMETLVSVGLKLFVLGTPKEH